MALQVIGASFGRTDSLEPALEQYRFAPCRHMLGGRGNPEQLASWEGAARRYTRPVDPDESATSANPGIRIMFAARIVLDLCPRARQPA